jgi:hypothetical protein
MLLLLCDGFTRLQFEHLYHVPWIGIGMMVVSCTSDSSDDSSDFSSKHKSLELEHVYSDDSSFCCIEKK